MARTLRGARALPAATATGRSRAPIASARVATGGRGSEGDGSSARQIRLPRRVSYRRCSQRRRSAAAIVSKARGCARARSRRDDAVDRGRFGEGTATSPSTGPPPAPPPANDTLAAAQAIHTLPASINGTTVGATTEAGERESACDVPTTSSVWYSLRLPAAHRVGLDLAASGRARRHDRRLPRRALAADLRRLPADRSPGQGVAFVRRRQERPVRDPRGRRCRTHSSPPFTLEVFLPTPAVQPPGPPLPAAGVSGQVDRIQNVNAAYSVTMHAGVSYLISLANETQQRRVRQRRPVRARHQLLRRRRRRSTAAPRC